MNIETTFTQDSQACPGVRFTMRVLNQYQRSLRDAKLIDARVHVSELSAQLGRVADPDAEILEIRARAKAENRELTDAEATRVDQIAADPAAAAPRIERAVIDHRIALIMNSELKPGYIRASLLAIDGLKIDGEAPKEPWDAVIQKAPDGLLDELYLAAHLNSGLTQAQEKN
jgi:hypothetical protein